MNLSLPSSKKKTLVTVYVNFRKDAKNVRWAFFFWRFLIQLEGGILDHVKDKLSEKLIEIFNTAALFYQKLSALDILQHVILYSSQNASLPSFSKIVIKALRDLREVEPETSQAKAKVILVQILCRLSSLSTLGSKTFWNPGLFTSPLFFFGVLLTVIFFEGSTREALWQSGGFEVLINLVKHSNKTFQLKAAITIRNLLFHGTDKSLVSWIAKFSPKFSLRGNPTHFLYMIFTLF